MRGTTSGLGYPPELKADLTLDGCGFIDPWIEGRVLPDHVVEKIEAARNLGHAEKRIRAISVELYGWLTLGDLEPGEVADAVRGLKADMAKIAKGRANRGKRREKGEDLNIADLTASKFLDIMHTAMLRYSVRNGIPTSAAKGFVHRREQQRARLIAEKRAEIEAGAALYRAAKDSE